MLSCPRRTSGQATKMLTRGTSGSMPTLMSRTPCEPARDPSPDARPPRHSTHMTPGKPTSWRTWRWQQRRSRPQTRRKRKTPATERQEEEWMVDLRSTMKANQALLERLLEERSQPQSRREAFIRFVSDTPCVLPLRRSTSRHCASATHGVLYIGGWTGPLNSTTTQQASTSQQSAITPPTYSQQYFHMPGCPSPNWQYGGGQHPQQSPSLQPLTDTCPV
ncbi:hypothetical protein GWK47_050087 [Chionoecetes opilio]|uniref:Uncharacterized protein n=1 Tax=Chionoecetes opilio TaxID=41210 RepID=A0A8J4Y1X6_CHIOP|nr:hypothetical protein GWK47_050087 [Chionoecetes opilio]